MDEEMHSLHCECFDWQPGGSVWGCGRLKHEPVGSGGFGECGELELQMEQTNDMIVNTGSTDYKGIQFLA